MESTETPAATEHICVSPATLTGSIGAVDSSRELDPALASIGVERRWIAFGPHKA